VESTCTPVTWVEWWCGYCHERYAIDSDSKDDTCPYCGNAGREFTGWDDAEE
jgi:rubrerythrin